MTCRLHTLFGLSLIAFGTHAFAQQDFSGVTIKTTHVAGQVYMLEGSGGNIGVAAGKDGVLMVDDQYAPLADKIRAAIKKINPGPLKFIINTHWHGDHVGGNIEFGPEAPIIAHANVRVRLTTEQKLFGRTIQPLTDEALPVVTFDDGLSVYFNGEQIKVFHLPHGHTDGDCVVHFTKSNVIHMGDLMFSGMFPFVDLDHGGDVEGMARNVAKIIKSAKPDVKIIPGHGPLSTLDDLKAFHEMLTATTDHVRKGMKSGKSLNDLKQAGFPDKWKSWANGFIKTDRWIETIYKSLKG